MENFVVNIIVFKIDEFFIAKSPDVDIVSQSLRSQEEAVERFLFALQEEKHFRQNKTLKETVNEINAETTSDDYKFVYVGSDDEYILYHLDMGFEIRVIKKVGEYN